MEFIAGAVSGLTVGEPATFRGLTMWPLVGEDATSDRYFTLDEALAQRWAHVSEVSAEGVVPEVRIVNEAPYHVLVVDGEELAGAKQDRVANVSVLVPHGATVVLPVSGVEAGRWSLCADTMRATSRLHFASGRLDRLTQVSASLREIGDRRAHQADVWAQIADRAAKLGVGSTTGAMSAIFDQHAAAIEDYVRAFVAAPAQRGACIEVEGGPIGFDVFDRAITLRHLLPKLLRSYALDALLVSAPHNRPTFEAGAVGRLLRAVARAKGDVYPAVGMGRDIRLSGAAFAGAALVAEGRVVHLCAGATVGAPA